MINIFELSFIATLTSPGDACYTCISTVKGIFDFIPGRLAAGCVLEPLKDILDFKPCVRPIDIPDLLVLIRPIHTIDFTPCIRPINNIIEGFRGCILIATEPTITVYLSLIDRHVILENGKAGDQGDRIEPDSNSLQRRVIRKLHLQQEYNLERSKQIRSVDRQPRCIYHKFGEIGFTPEETDYIKRNLHIISEIRDPTFYIKAKKICSTENRKSVISSSRLRFRV